MLLKCYNTTGILQLLQLLVKVTHTLYNGITTSRWYQRWDDILATFRITCW